MSDKIRDENIDYLFKAILSLKDERECYNFFEDLCTVSEIKEMSKRLLAARLLADNCIYANIAKQTGLSTATISRVNRCLQYGDGGYGRALQSLQTAK